MFTYITLALATVASVSGLVIPRGQPATYGSHLENYDTYHTRYLAIGCKGKQGTPFFDLCCHPMLAGEVLQQARPAQCIPGAASSAAPSKTVSATPSPSASEDPEEGWCYEGDEGCDCEDEETSSSSSAPTSTAAPAETPSPRPDITVKPTSAKPTSTPKPTSSPAPGNGEVISGGSATYFYQNGVAGACGIVHSDSDFIAALPGAMYGDYSQKSSKCGQKIRVTRTSNGKTVDVIIADACPSCTQRGDVDLSQGAFRQLGTDEEGMFPITYQFL